MESKTSDRDVMVLIGLVIMLEAKVKAGEITDKFHIATIEKADKCVMECRESEYAMYERICYELLTVHYGPQPEPKEPCRKILHS